MRPFNKEEIETLKQYENRFYSAVNSNFARHLSSGALNTIKDIFVSAGGSGFTPNWSCSHCTLNFLKLVGKKYFEDLKLIEAETQKLIEATNSLGDSASRAAQLVKALDEVFAEVPDENQITKPKKTKKNGKESGNKKGTTEA